MFSDPPSKAPSFRNAEGWTIVKTCLQPLLLNEETVPISSSFVKLLFAELCFLAALLGGVDFLRVSYLNGRSVECL